MDATIPLPIATNSFREHLNDPNNKRILFSGKFGTGKSTFLDNYLSSDDGDFTVLKLYPVNYSVASNEDVFELIKYDLFSELLAKYADKVDMKNEDFSTLLVAQSYLANDIKIYPFIKAVIKAIIPNGDAIADTGDEAKKIYTNFKAYQEKINRGEIDVINDYIKWCEQKKGSIYERDEIPPLAHACRVCFNRHSNVHIFSYRKALI